MNWVFMFLILVINSGFVICSEINTENVSEKKPYETQRAQCTVTAGEVKASAEAVVSKTLEGVCGSDEIKVAFRNLELKITQELEMIKDLIKNLQSGNTPVKVAATSKPNDRQELNSNLLKINTPTLKPLNAISPHYAEKNVNGAKTESNDKPKKPTVGQPILKTLPVDHSSRKIKSSRDMEIDKLNNTLLSGSETKLFAYYWKLDKFTQKLKSNISIDHSPVFSILGKRLRLKALFNHLKRNFLYLMVENANNVHDEFQSIFLETGNIFKPLQTKFEFKHKIAVLEQVSTGATYTSLALYFARGISTVSDVITETTAVIWAVLQKDYMAIPSTEKWKVISNRFYELWNMPNCLGAMDGKHIRIQQLPSSGSTNYNYKGYHSIILFAVCDADGFFYNDRDRLCWKE